MKEELDSISLRDYIAVEAMKAKIQVWDGDLSKKQRIAILEDLTERYPEGVKVGEGLARTCYELADDMLKAREHNKEEQEYPLNPEFSVGVEIKHRKIYTR